MAFLDNVLSALDHWPEWKKLRATPAKVDELEQRIVALEARLQRAPGEACPSCGALAFRVEKSEPSQTSFADLGARDYHWKCQECGYGDVRMK
jgi:ribosomal protein L37E